MLKIIVSGCNGHMGQCVVCGCEGLEGVEVVAGFNRTPLKKNCFEVYSDPMSYEGPADVVIDFSNPANLDALLEFCLLRKIPIVLCTTGYSEEQLHDIEKAAGADTGVQVRQHVAGHQPYDAARKARRRSAR